MTTIPHEPASQVGDRQQWIGSLELSEMWASLAITMMWLAVLFDSVFGPDIVSNGGGAAGGGGSTVPSAIAVAFFATLGTAAVAKYGLGRDKETDG